MKGHNSRDLKYQYGSSYPWGTTPLAPTGYPPDYKTSRVTHLCFLGLSITCTYLPHLQECMGKQNPGTVIHRFDLKSPAVLRFFKGKTTQLPYCLPMTNGAIKTPQNDKHVE